MDLPKELEEQFREELYQYEKEKRMPYVTSFEQIGIEKGMQKGMQRGLLKGIEPLLEMKFGAAGLQLMSEIRQIEDVEILDSLIQAIKTADTPDDLRRIWAP